MTTLSRPFRGGVPLNPRTALQDLIAWVFSATFAKAFTSPIASPGAAAIPWWLSGGIAAANCVAAWTLKNAASLAAARVNLNNPGTYDLIDAGVSYSWSSAGLKCWGDKASVYAAIPGTQAFSYVVRFSGMVTANTRLIGFHKTATNTFYSVCAPTWSSSDLYYFNGSFGTPSAAYGSGVTGMSGNQPYKNGSADGSVVGSGNWSYTNFYFYCDVTQANAPTFQAVAVYNKVLNGTENLALAAAIAAL